MAQRQTMHWTNTEFELSHSFVEMSKAMKILDEILGDKLTFELPGIGFILSQRLNRLGYSKASDLCTLLLRNNCSYHTFHNFLTNEVRADTEQVNRCYVCLILYVKKFGPPRNTVKNQQEYDYYYAMVQNLTNLSDIDWITFGSDCRQWFDYRFGEKIDYTPPEYKKYSEAILSTIRAIPDTAKTAQIKNNYEFVKKLGQGSYGSVFEMLEKGSNRHVAMKIISMDKNCNNFESERERMLREVQALAKLDHQRIVRYFNSWTELLPQNWLDLFMSGSNVLVLPTFKESESYFFIAMEFCSDRTLEDFLDRHAKRNGKHMIRIFLQILDAVKYIHENGLMHRDLKPSNIFLTVEGNVKVGDFGLVKSLADKDSRASDSCKMETSGSGETAEHTRGVGSRDYMSPELIAGTRYSNKVDMFSLGVILFEMICIVQRHRRSRLLEKARQCQFSYSFKSKFSILYGILKKLLAQNADNRPTAGQMFDEISMYMDD